MSRISKILAQAVSIENTPIVGNCARFLIRLDNSPVTRDDILKKGSQVRTTKGYYFIKYTPRRSYQRKELAPFVLICDMLRFTVRVRNSEMLEKAASIFPEIKWVIENTNYTPGIFKWAILHPGMAFPFSVNWDKYCKDIIDKAGALQNASSYAEQYKPLITFQTASSNWDVDFNDDEYFNPYEKDCVDQLIELKQLDLEFNKKKGTK